jgi:hypothetical protein
METNQDAIDRYYKYYSLSGVSPKLLKNEEHFNLHIRPKKEKRSEQPKVIVWKANAVQDYDLLELPMDVSPVRVQQGCAGRSRQGREDGRLGQKRWRASGPLGADSYRHYG